MARMWRTLGRVAAALLSTLVVVDRLAGRPRAGRRPGHEHRERLDHRDQRRRHPQLQRHLHRRHGGGDRQLGHGERDGDRPGRLHRLQRHREPPRRGLPVRHRERARSWATSSTRAARPSPSRSRVPRWARWARPRPPARSTTTTRAPSSAINSVSQNEGNSGTANQAFTISLSTASGRTSSVSYPTQSGTATSGSDFTSTTGSVTFAAGETTKTVNVPVKGDVTVETNETYTVRLCGASNAELRRESQRDRAPS